MGREGIRALVACMVTVVSLQVRAAEPGDPGGDWRYRVQEGDTLLSLSEDWLDPRYGWRDLQRLNRVSDPQRLMPGSTLRMPLTWLRRQASVAQAVFVRGDAVRLRGSGTEAIATGAILQSGDRIRTGDQASVSLRLADGSRLLVPPQSEVALQELLVLGRGALPSARIGVSRGEVDQRVAPNAQRVPLYEVRTPHVNLGVRGTEFRVQAETGISRLMVLSGAVHADGVERDVSVGQGLVAAQGSRRVVELLPAPELSELAVRSDRLPLKLSWPASPAGAVAWRVQLLGVGGPDQLLLDARVDHPDVSWPQARELADGGYVLRVRGVDAQGLEGLASERELQLLARPEPPFVREPSADAVVYGDTVALGWTLNTEAPRVRLQVARDAEFQDLVLQPGPLDSAGLELTRDALGGNGAYFWRIAAVTGEGRAGPFGDAQRFELRPPPPSPPAAEPQTSGDQLLLRWRADPGVVRYELEWSSAQRFDTGDVQRFSTERPQLAIPRPAPGNYFLRARAFNSAGAASPWGQVQKIEQPYPSWLWLLPLLLVPLF